MMATETVHDRIALARLNLTATQAGLGLLLVGLLGAAMLFVQEPTAHEAFHNLRHAAGVACH